MNHELKSKPSRKRITIHLAAKETGVLASTISGLLTKNGPVHKDLRQPVLQAVETLAYRPDQIARSLKNRETCTLG
jgi:LacI family transcriptional regulator